jgi:hypothetical protein
MKTYTIFQKKQRKNRKKNITYKLQMHFLGSRRYFFVREMAVTANSVNL